MKKLLLVAVPVLALVIAYLAVQMTVSQTVARQITSEVELVNRCDVPDQYFAIQHVPTGRQFRFSGGRVKLNVKEGELLKLVLSSRYDQVEYDGVTVRATTFQKVTADCSLGERQHGVTDGLRGAFGG